MCNCQTQIISCIVDDLHDNLQPFLCSLKFLPGRLVNPSGTRDFPNLRAAASSPLATEIFRIHGVSNVFFGADFVAVTKRNDVPWESVQPAVTNTMTEFFASGQPILIDDGPVASAIDGDTSEVGVYNSSLQLLCVLAMFCFTSI